MIKQNNIKLNRLNTILSFFFITCFVLCLKWNALFLPIHLDGLTYVRTTEWIYENKNIFPPYNTSKTDDFSFNIGHPPALHLYIIFFWMLFGKSVFVTHFAILFITIFGLYFLYLFLCEYMSQYHSLLITGVFFLYPMFFSQSVLVNNDIISISLIFVLLYYLKKDNILVVSIVLFITLFFKETNCILYPPLLLYVFFKTKNNWKLFYKKAFIITVPIITLFLFFYFKNTITNYNIVSEAHKEVLNYNINLILGQYIKIFHENFIWSQAGMFPYQVPFFILFIISIIYLFPYKKNQFKKNTIYISLGWVLCYIFIKFCIIKFSLVGNSTMKILNKLEMFSFLYYGIYIYIVTFYRNIRLGSISIFVIGFFSIAILFFSLVSYTLYRYYLVFISVFIIASFFCAERINKKLFYIVLLMFSIFFFMNHKGERLINTCANAGDELESNMEYIDIVAVWQKAIDFINKDLNNIFYTPNNLPSYMMLRVNGYNNQCKFTKDIDIGNISIISRQGHGYLEQKKVLLNNSFRLIKIFYLNNKSTEVYKRE